MILVLRLSYSFDTDQMHLLLKGFSFFLINFEVNKKLQEKRSSFFFFFLNFATLTRSVWQICKRWRLSSLLQEKKKKKKKRKKQYRRHFRKCCVFSISGAFTSTIYVKKTAANKCPEKYPIVWGSVKQTFTINMVNFFTFGCSNVCQIIWKWKYLHQVEY